MELISALFSFVSPPRAAQQLLSPEVFSVCPSVYRGNDNSLFCNILKIHTQQVLLCFVHCHFVMTLMRCCRNLTVVCIR